MQRQKAAGLVPEGDDGIPGKLDLDAEDEVTADDTKVVLWGLLSGQGHH